MLNHESKPSRNQNSHRGSHPVFRKNKVLRSHPDTELLLIAIISSECFSLDTCHVISKAVSKPVTHILYSRFTVNEVLFEIEMSVTDHLMKSVNN